MEKVIKLFNLLDSLIRKQVKLDAIIEVLGGTPDLDFLNEDIKKVELMIVEAFGGNVGHYRHIVFTSKFDNYRLNEENREELMDYIGLTIENNWTEKI
jgi:hypothetical protein